jgi:hypothetical protein
MSESPSTVSAQVVLRSESGKVPHGAVRITSANVQDYQPSADTVAAATGAFTRLGFAVTPVVGNSFSITAQVETFERVFGTAVRCRKSGEALFVNEQGGESYELPSRQIPRAVRDTVLAVSFTRPPDFGPAEFAR